MYENLRDSKNEIRTFNIYYSVNLKNIYIYIYLYIQIFIHNYIQGGW